MDIIKQIAKRIAKSSLQRIARLILVKYKPKVIAITGSVGKTSTRDATYAILSRKFFVRKSEKSFTSGLGVPLAIIGHPEGVETFADVAAVMFLGLMLLVRTTEYPELLILEIDSDKPGDIEGIQWLAPDVLAITAIGDAPSHIESFETIEDFLKEKKYLVQAVPPTGTIVYNADDIQATKLARESSIAVISCSIGSVGDIMGDTFDVLYSNAKTGEVPTGMSFSVSSSTQIENEENKMEWNVTIFDSLGVHNEYACLLAIGIARVFGISLSDSVSALLQYRSPLGRMNIIKGIRESVIIDDTYNASPLAMEQAIDVLSHLVCRGKKIAVVGDMFELGKYSTDEHKKLASLLSGVATAVVCVGIRSRPVYEALLATGYDTAYLSHVTTAEEAEPIVRSWIEPGDIILVKGSQTMRLEKVVAGIMRHPEDAPGLLVRQDVSWQERQ